MPFKAQLTEAPRGRAALSAAVTLAPGKWRCERGLFVGLSLPLDCAPRPQSVAEDGGINNKQGLEDRGLPRRDDIVSPQKDTPCCKITEGSTLQESPEDPGTAARPTGWTG